MRAINEHDGRIPAGGGLLVGALTLLTPRVAGTGRATIASLLSGERLGWRAPASTLTKVGATALTLGSGGSGGAFLLRRLLPRLPPPARVVSLP